ncbi:MAG: hypothetical protein R3C58_08310 [Parvularculaceae bacterium]
MARRNRLCDHARREAGRRDAHGAGTDRHREESRSKIVIRAQTLPEENASISILKKLGFVKFSEVMHPEDGLVWEWRLPIP